MRLALRTISRNPWFSALCVCSLAAGIGLTAALASVADAILFRPLPVPRPQEIVRIFTASTGQPRGFVSFRDFEDFRRSARMLNGIAAQTQVLAAVGGDGSSPPTIRLGLAVSADYFDVLGVSAAVGRTFRQDEWHEPVVVLSDTFSPDRDIVGKTIRIGGTPFTVLGIAPRSFGLDRFVHESFYVPMGVYESGILPSNGRPLEDRGRRYLSIYGRLSAGAKLNQARTALVTIGARLEAAYPATNHGRRAILLSESETRAASDHTLPQLVALMFAMAVLILAIASANASGLLLSRAEARAKEIAVRLALGATRARLAMDSMLEAALLAAAGAALGIPVAWAAIRLLARIATLPTDFPFAIAPRMDPRVVLIAAIATTLAAIACGCGPAMTNPRVSIARSLALGGRAGSRPSKWRNVLVTVEIAAASALVATGASLVVQVKSAIAANPGYRTEHVLVMALDPAQTGYTRAATSAFYERLLIAVRGLPVVNATALAQSAVLSYTRTPAQVEIDHEAVTIWMNAVTPGYFALMRMPLAAGRAFDDRDTESSLAVAIVNEELARRCGISRLDGGARLRVNGVLLQVIGIARNAKYFEIQESPQPYLYLPYSQRFASRMVLHVETAGDPARAGRPILEEIRRMDPAQPVSELRPLRDYLEQGSMFAARIAIDAIGAVGLCALVLALAGIFGVVSHAVECRRREIGIRIALGAEPQSIIKMILRGIAAPIATGTVGGLLVSASASKLLASLVGSGFGHAGDVGRWEFAGAYVVAVTCLIAAMIPATRAARAAHIRPAQAFGED
jgi:putative ABC transport system permease protein